MKTLADLEAIRKKTLDQVTMRKEEEGIRVVVGMGTCGISAGARTVMQAFMDEVTTRNLANVTITQAGCMGFCKEEPMVDVYIPGKDKVTYVRMDADMAKRVVNDHIVNGNVVSEYTIK